MRDIAFYRGEDSRIEWKDLALSNIQRSTSMFIARSCGFVAIDGGSKSSTMLNGGKRLSKNPEIVTQHP